MSDKPLQAAIDVVNAVEMPDSALICAKVRALARGYWARWATVDAFLKPVHIERTLSCRLPNPDTGKFSRDLLVGGKIDVVFDRMGKTVFFDHKTVSEDIADPAGTYWKQLIVDSQPSHYHWLLWLNGEKVDECTWNCLRKPSISPKQLKSKAERASAIAERRYFNAPLSQATLDWLQTNDREDLPMYEARLTHDCTIERPDWYFQRRTVPRLDDELMEYGRDLWDAGQLILDARRHNRWMKHPRSCMQYGRPCPYLGICSGYTTPDGPEWTKREKVHPELDSSDHNTLTFSSIRCYQTCPRKFYFLYELGISKRDEEESEALFFGSLMHTCLEVLYKEIQYGNDSPAAQGNDLGATGGSQAELAAASHNDF
jgi:hypothetical protein